ncbi:universal stress protein [Streptomyces sp. NPDC058145]|uniref:universal stress protein n=1 Tax=Streptomyces sp. NPDC058145 TaxID=3346356 RepID=UPI0036F104D9
MPESLMPPAARVVVGVSGSPGSLIALGRAADEARLRGAELWPVVTWQPPEGDLAARRFPATTAMVPEWERLARERLVAALRDVFGGAGTGLPGQALVVRGAPGAGCAERRGRRSAATASPTPAAPSWPCRPPRCGRH